MRLKKEFRFLSSEQTADYYYRKYTEFRDVFDRRCDVPAMTMPTTLALLSVMK